MESSVNVPYALLIPGTILLTVTTALAVALLIAGYAARRRARDRRPARSQCTVKGCTRLHLDKPSPYPHISRAVSHRQDPRPDGPIVTALAVIACGFGLIRVPKGHHNRW